MLSDQMRQLLTAYVDGELTARQRKLVLRLLQRSAEARILLQKLQADAEALRRMPRVKLRADFSQRVIEAVEAHQLQPGRPRQATRRAGVPTWVGVAVAAGVLFAVAAGSFLFFAKVGPQGSIAWDLPFIRARPSENSGPQFPQHHDPENHSGSMTRRDPDADPLRGPDPDPPSKDPVPPTPDKPDPRGPTPPAKDPAAGIYTGGYDRPQLKPTVVSPVTAVPLKVRDVDGKQLRAELQKAEFPKDPPGFRLELPCDASGKALERLRAAFRAHEISLTLDRVVQARLKNPTLKNHFVVFAEDLTPEDLVKLLVKLGADDKRAKEKVFDGLVLSPLTPSDRQELAKLLGIDTKGLAGQGGGRPASSKVEQRAVAMPYLLDRPMPISAEVKDFVAARKPARTGTLQVMLVLRDVSD